VTLGQWLGVALGRELGRALGQALGRRLTNGFDCWLGLTETWSDAWKGTGAEN
jgi:hypothetical protein